MSQQPERGESENNARPVKSRTKRDKRSESAQTPRRAKSDDTQTLTDTLPAIYNRFVGIAAEDNGSPSPSKADWPLSRLGVELQLERRLVDAGIGTIGELAAKTPDELLRLPRVNAKAVKNILELLGYLGFTLAAATSARHSTVASIPQAQSAAANDVKTHKYPTEADRANAFATAHGSPARGRPRRGPNLDDPDHVQRVKELRNTVTMEVEDAAWLYGISRGAAYAACNAGQIPTKKFDDRMKVFTKPVFDELFPEGPSVAKAPRPWNDVA